jgi:hypothetical protein
MSLINDALKRAQNLNTVSANVPQPADGPTQPIHIPKRAEPMSAKKMVITLGIVIGTLLIMVVGLGVGFYVLYLKSDEPAQVVQIEQPVQLQATEATPVSVEEHTHVTKISEIIKEANAGTVEASSQNGTPIIGEVSTEIAETSLQETAPIVEEEQVPWVNNPYPEVIAYVDSITVTGIRTSNGQSRVLMNNKVYKTGEIVNRSLGLKLTDVRQDELVFEDAEKNIYTAYF